MQEEEREMTPIPAILQREVSELLTCLAAPKRNEPEQYEVIKTRLDCMRFVTQIVERQCANTADLRGWQEWFRAETDPYFSLSNTCRRARVWPEGFPGDFRTLEGIYANAPIGEGLAAHLDRYSISSTLAIAIRSRLRKLGELLQERASFETTSANWLNLACGSCRELLAVSSPHAERITVQCVDTDPNALAYAKKLLQGNGIKTNFIVESAFRFVNAERNRKRFGGFSLIYSAGLFDYIPNDRLVKLLKALYHSLQPGGVLIAPFKEMRYYETFDYHWFSDWNYFLQRSEADFRSIFKGAGMADDAISMERDESGVLLFFSIRK